MFATLNTAVSTYIQANKPAAARANGEVWKKMKSCYSHFPTSRSINFFLLFAAFDQRIRSVWCVQLAEIEREWERERWKSASGRNFHCISRQLVISAQPNSAHICNFWFDEQCPSPPSCFFLPCVVDSFCCWAKEFEFLVSANLLAALARRQSILCVLFFM